jgi:hypothetical protein
MWAGRWDGLEGPPPGKRPALPHRSGREEFPCQTPGAGYDVRAERRWAPLCEHRRHSMNAPIVPAAVAVLFAQRAQAA